MKSVQFGKKLDELVEEMNHLKVRFSDFDSYYSYLNSLSTYIMQERGETMESHPKAHEGYMIRHLENVRDIALQLRKRNIQITTGEVYNDSSGYMIVNAPTQNSIPRIARDYARNMDK